MDQSKWYESSTGSGLSLTVGGFSVMGVAQAIVVMLALLHVQVDANSVAALIAAGLALVGAAMTAYGLARKVILSLHRQLPPPPQN